MTLNILVAEPNNELRVLLAESLQQIGSCVFTTKDGVEALEILENNYPHVKFDVLVSEIQMPRMNGFELMRRVLVTNDNFRDLNPIFFTDRCEEKWMVYWAFTGSSLYGIVSKLTGRVHKKKVFEEISESNKSLNLYGSTNACQESIVSLIQLIQSLEKSH